MLLAPAQGLMATVSCTHADLLAHWGACTSLLCMQHPCMSARAPGTPNGHPVVLPLHNARLGHSLSVAPAALQNPVLHVGPTP